MAEPRKLADLDPTALEHEKKWRAERVFPLFEVVLSGPEIEYSPRPDERYWKSVEREIEGQKVTVWVSKTGKPVVLPAYARVRLHAVNEEVARAKALSDNPQCDKVESAKQIQN